jgi:hypothetical protein
VTTTTTADLARGPAAPDDEATQAIATSQPQSPATTTIPTTTTTPDAGSPCDPASGLPDCTDASADGTFRIVSGYADCVAAVGEDGGICTDLDGDGLAGYPDSG